MENIILVWQDLLSVPFLFPRDSESISMIRFDWTCYLICVSRIHSCSWHSFPPCDRDPLSVILRNPPTLNLFFQNKEFNKQWVLDGGVEVSTNLFRLQAFIIPYGFFCFNTLGPTMAQGCSPNVGLKTKFFVDLQLRQATVFDKTLNLH